MTNHAIHVLFAREPSTARRSTFIRLMSSATAILILPGAALAEAPPIATALKLKPVQEGVEYDAPAADEVDACTIKSEKIAGANAWVVRDGNGVTLRQFSDSNADNVVDIWSYFNNGLEVYRDVDSNFNGKADQYRWYHTAGSKIGVDSNEDGAIDSWKRLSPEEAAEEVVIALKNNNADQFKRLLLTSADVKKLGLSDDMADEVAKRTKEAPAEFALVQKANKITKQAEFSDFGGLRPGMVPAGTRGATKDVLVYENAWAMVYAGDDPVQVRLGAMVEVDGVWKLIDGPSLDVAGQSTVGLFFDANRARPTAMASTEVPQQNEEMQKLLTEIERIDKELASASKQRQPTLNARRADVLERLAALAPNATERNQWLMQLADMVGNAYQTGGYPDGGKRLQKWEADLAKDKANDDLVAHFKFQRMLAEYGLDLSDPKANQMKIQEAWLEKLESFVDDHKGSSHVAEALIQLAMNSEFSGETEDALKWYQRIVRDFPQSANADKARGAVTRLRSEGRTIKLTGKSLQGRDIDLQRMRGKVVLIQYWMTLDNAGANDHAELKDLYSKYGGNRFDIVGVNLDYNREDVVNYLRSNRLPWQQLYEPEGFDGRLAKEMGVMTAPLMILVGADGKVINRDVQLLELEDELKELLADRVSRRE